jgi:hypothetical protein
MRSPKEMEQLILKLQQELKMLKDQMISSGVLPVMNLKPLAA